MSKTASIPTKKVSVTEIESNPLAAALVLEQQSTSKEYLFSTGTAPKPDELLSKCPSKSQSKRASCEKRQKDADKYDSRNQMIMVAGPTGKQQYDKTNQRRSYSPTESFHKIG